MAWFGRKQRPAPEQARPPMHRPLRESPEFPRFVHENGGPHLAQWGVEIPRACGEGFLVSLTDPRAVQNPIGLQYEHLLVVVGPADRVLAVFTAETAAVHNACYFGVFAGGSHTNLGEEPAMRGRQGFQAFLDRAVPLAEAMLQTPAPPQPVTPDEAREQLRELRRRTGQHPPDGERLRADLAELAVLLDALGAPDGAAAARAASTAPQDPDALFQAGYEFIDLGLNDLAIAPLQRAFDLRPEHLNTLLELVVALENVERYDQVVAVLRRAYWAVERVEIVRALYSHSVAMTGDLATTRQLYPTLGEENEVAAVLKSVAGMRIARHDALAAVGRPAGQDLRAWELLLNGLLVLDLTGPEYEGMGGRWGAVWDQPDSFATRLTLLQHALARAGRAVSVVAHAADRDSEILAWALGTRLGRPVVPLSGDLPEYALVVVYSWANAAATGLQALRYEDRTAVLFSYGLDWTGSSQPGPDIAGLEAQAFFPPWGEGTRVVGTPGEPDFRVERTPADSRPAEVIGRELAAVGGQPEPAQVADILGLVDALRARGAPSGLTTGQRQIFYPGGPVRSSRFE
jgi:tetratricopeptide (TPR) repeat protein